MEKKILFITTIILAIALIVLWITNVLDNERFLWIIGVLGTSGSALYQWLVNIDKEKEIKLLKDKN